MTLATLMESKVRDVTLDDVPALAALGRSTFTETFGHLYSPENLEKFLSEVHSDETVAREITNPKRLFRVVEQDGQLMAYCKLGLDLSLDFDVQGRKGMELKQLYLSADLQGTGVAGTLMQWTLEEARTHEMEVILLSVYSENYRAQRFYERYGFSKFADTFFMVGDHRDEEYIYGLSLELSGP